MTTKEKKEFIKGYCELYNLENENSLANPCFFMDYDSDKNLDLKLKTLRRMVDGEILSEEELYNKDVFEKLPSGKIGVDYTLN